MAHPLVARLGRKTPPFHRSPAPLKLPMMLLCKGMYAPHFKGKSRQCSRHAPTFRRPCRDKSVLSPKTPERRFVGNYELQSHHHHQVPLAPILQAFWNFRDWNQLLQCSNNPLQYFGSKIRSVRMHHLFPALLRSNHLLRHCLNVLSS